MPLDSHPEQAPGFHLIPVHFRAEITDVTLDSGSDGLHPKPVVSIIMPTFQHGEFIRQALQSVLDQETSFPIEILVGDDSSTDGAYEIAREIQRQHPERIRLLGSSCNLHTRFQPRMNALRLLSVARGEYTALLEGDDYWTDPQKLERQVGALRANPDAVLCVTYGQELIDDHLKNVPPPYGGQEQLSWTTILTKNQLHTASTIFRSAALPASHPAFLKVPYGDWLNYVRASLQSPILVIPEPMVVYRRHAGGIHSGRLPLDLIPEAKVMYDIFKELVPKEHHYFVDQCCNQYVASLREAATDAFTPESIKAQIADGSESPYWYAKCLVSALKGKLRRAAQVQSLSKTNIPADPTNEAVTPKRLQSRSNP